MLLHKIDLQIQLKDLQNRRKFILETSKNINNMAFE